MTETIQERTEVDFAILRMHADLHEKQGATAWARDIRTATDNIQKAIKEAESQQKAAMKERPNFPKRELEEEGREIDEDWPEMFACALGSCGRSLEPMEPYIIAVINNTDEPLQATYRFCSPEHAERWSDGGMLWQGKREAKSESEGRDAK